MRAQTTFRSAALSALLLFTALGAHAAAPWGRTWTPDGVRVAYRGFVPSQEGRYPRSAGSWIEVRIHNFTTEREARAIVDLYGRSEDLPLRHVLGNRDIGTLRIGDRLAQPLAAAWRIRDLSGEHLILLVPRNPAVRELLPERARFDRYDRPGRYDRDARDDRYSRLDRYDGAGHDRRDAGFERPYALLQLDLGSGRERYGRGELRTASRLELGAEGGFDFEETGAQPVRILHVERIQP